MKWFKIEGAIQVNANIQKIKVNNQTICLINSNGKYSACDAKCPHAGADLSNGWLEGNEIICPFHRYKYDLCNGRGATGQGDYLPVYKIEKRVDGLYVQLPEKWWKRLFTI
jgi:3-phenylpropionate/trans-cinnamate dioxygenase ferredoxin subunit